MNKAKRKTIIDEIVFELTEPLMIEIRKMVGGVIPVESSSIRKLLKEKLRAILICGRLII